MDTFCILFRKAPYGTIEAAEGLRHLIAAARMMAARAVLLDDGVYLAKRGQEPGDSGWINLSQTLENALADCGADPSCQLHVYVHEGSLKERNLDPAALVSGVELADDDQVATVIAEARRMLIF